MLAEQADPDAEQHGEQGADGKEPRRERRLARGEVHLVATSSIDNGP